MCLKALKQYALLLTACARPFADWLRACKCCIGDKLNTQMMHMLQGLWNKQALYAHADGQCFEEENTLGVLLCPQASCGQAGASKEVEARQPLHSPCCRASGGCSALAETDMPVVFRPGGPSEGVLGCRLAAGEEALRRGATAREAEAALARAQDALQHLRGLLSAGCN